MLCVLNVILLARFFSDCAVRQRLSGVLTLISNNIKLRSIFHLREALENFQASEKGRKITIYDVPQVTYTINTNSITFFMDTHRTMGL